MVAATVWRKVFSFNKYAGIAARALRQSLKDDARAVAEKRGSTSLRYQHWENGQGGIQTPLNPPKGQH